MDDVGQDQVLICFENPWELVDQIRSSGLEVFWILENSHEATEWISFLSKAAYIYCAHMLRENSIAVDLMVISPSLRNNYSLETVRMYSVVTNSDFANMDFTTENDWSRKKVQMSDLFWKAYWNDDRACFYSFRSTLDI